MSVNRLENQLVTVTLTLIIYRHEFLFSLLHFPVPLKITLKSYSSLSKELYCDSFVSLSSLFRERLWKICGSTRCECKDWKSFLLGWEDRSHKGQKKKKKVFFAYFLFNAQGRSFLEELSDISFRHNTLGLIFHFG